MDERDEAPMHPAPPTETPRGAPSLHRSATRRIFGGVAGGLGERFDVDANIVRVVFVVLALIYGLGIAIYLAMWVLIPRDPNEVEEPIEDTPRVRWLRYALPLAVVVLALIAVFTIHFLPNVGKGLSLLWLVFLVVLAVIALFTPSTRLTFRRFVALAFLFFVSLLIVLSGATLLALQVIGVPVRGGSGARAWQPTTMAEVHRYYHGAFGTTTIDLSRVAFSGTTRVTATEGIGQLTVDVPAGVKIDLRTSIGIGGVENFSVPAPPGDQPSAPHAGSDLVLDLEVGIGKIRLVHLFSASN